MGCHVLINRVSRLDKFYEMVNMLKHIRSSLNKVYKYGYHQVEKKEHLMLVCTRLCSICGLDITCSNGCKCTNNGWEKVEVWLKCQWVIAVKMQTKNVQSLVTHTSVTCKLWHERLNHGWFETSSPSTDTRLPQPCSLQPHRSKPIRELNLWEQDVDI